jgi:hypothetical protein
VISDSSKISYKDVIKDYNKIQIEKMKMGEENIDLIKQENLKRAMEGNLFMKTYKMNQEKDD